MRAEFRVGLGVGGNLHTTCLGMLCAPKGSRMCEMVELTLVGSVPDVLDASSFAVAAAAAAAAACDPVASATTLLPMLALINARSRGASVFAAGCSACGRLVAAAAAASDALVAEGRAVGFTHTSVGCIDPGGGLAPTAAASIASGTGALARSNPPRLPRRLGVRGGVAGEEKSPPCVPAVPNLGKGPDHEADTGPYDLSAFEDGRGNEKSWTDKEEDGRERKPSLRDLMRAAGVSGFMGWWSCVVPSPWTPWGCPVAKLSVCSALW